MIRRISILVVLAAALLAGGLVSVLSEQAPASCTITGVVYQATPTGNVPVTSGTLSVQILSAPALFYNQYPMQVPIHSDGSVSFVEPQGATIKVVGYLANNFGEGKALTVPVSSSADLYSLAKAQTSVMTNPMISLGDMVYGGPGGIALRLPGDISNSPKFLQSLSVSGVATAPVWASLPIMVGDTGTGGISGAVPAPAAGDASKFLAGDGTWKAATGAGLGTVTSVGLALPSWLSVSGSPVTTSGTLTVTAASGQTANEFLATPDGATGSVSLRAIVAGDVPSLPESRIANLVSDLAGKQPAGSYESPLTFSTGLTRTVNTITVNAINLASGGSGGVTGNLPWAQIDKTTSSLADITTRSASDLTSGLLALARGGTGADLSATGGSSQVVKQTSVGGAFTVAQLAASDISGLAASATTDTTNASNISSGTLGAARLPNPSATTLGGIESIAAVSHQFITSISTSGVPSLAQPAAGDLTGWPANAAGALTNDGAGNLSWAAGGGVSSVSNSDGTLTISPTTGAVIASLALGHANTWTGIQTLGSGLLKATSPWITTDLKDSNGNSMLAFTATASAVDGFTFTNAATANPATLTLAVTGSDANINFALATKGTGQFKIGTPTTADSAADFLVGISGTARKGVVIQSLASLTASPFQVQNSDGTAFLDVQRDGNLVINQKFSLVSTKMLEVQFQGTSQFYVQSTGIALARVGFNGGGGFFTTDGSGNVVALGTYTGKHYLGNGTSPTVADDGNHDSTIAGKDAFCKVTVGTGTINTITVTFGTAYGAAPVAQVRSNTNVDFRVSTTTTALTITRAGGAFTGGEVLHISVGGF